MDRILLVDDEPNVLSALRRELQDEYEIELFSSPAEALQRCHEAQFDLVVADYKMPDMNGIEFLKHFGKLQPDATRLVLSGQADASVLAKAINETHIYRFIDKPWDRMALSAALVQALNYRKALLENRRLAAAAGAVRGPVPGGLLETERRYQILVVDDEPNVLSAVTRDLTSRSVFQELHMSLLQEADEMAPLAQADLRFDVYTASTAQEALEFGGKVNCDVVIVDYLMPDMKGTELMERFRAEQPDAVLIMLSGHADKQALTEALNHLGIFGFIRKPWREYELKSAVLQAIAYKKLTQSNRQLAQQLH